MTTNLAFIILLSIFEILPTIDSKKTNSNKGKYCIEYKKRKTSIQPIIHGAIRSLEGSRILTSSAIVVNNKKVFTNNEGLFQLELRKGTYSIIGRDINYGDIKINSILLSNSDSVEVDLWLPDGPPLIDKRM